MRKQTWLNFKNKKWENAKKIKNLNRTIYNNLCDSNKEKFDLKTEISNMEFEIQIIRDPNCETNKIF